MVIVAPKRESTKPPDSSFPHKHAGRCRQRKSTCFKVLQQSLLFVVWEVRSEFVSLVAVAGQPGIKHELALRAR
jgi:hypothetical protein